MSSGALLRLGSLRHELASWPVSLQHWHRSVTSSWSSSFISSSSSSVTCLENQHPTASRWRLPQHHHMTPSHADEWVRQDQFKFSSSEKLRPQFLQTWLMFRCFTNLYFMYFPQCLSALWSCFCRSWIYTLHDSSSDLSCLHSCSRQISRFWELAL